MNSIRNAVIAIIALAALSVLLNNVTGATTETTTAPARHYYLTKGAFNGNQALTACTTGYHFASFAELLDPAILTYNKTLGRSAADDGTGPPSFAYGWARTGYSSSSGSTEYPNNCNVWTSGATTDQGTIGGFAPPYLSPVNNTYVIVPAPLFNQAECDNSQGFNIGVWCVQN
jgi:hypothetical protein